MCFTWLSPFEHDGMHGDIQVPMLSLLAQRVAQSGPRSVGKRLPLLCQCFHTCRFSKLTKKKNPYGEGSQVS